MQNELTVQTKDKRYMYIYIYKEKGKKKGMTYFLRKGQPTSD